MAGSGGRHPWSPDLLLDPARVAVIVGARFPELRPVDASWLGRGWGLDAFLVNGEWVFRFPMRASIGPGIAREPALLRALAAWLPLPVPEVRFLGDPGPDFPWPFSGETLIRGLPADRTEPPPSARPALAAALGGFLTRLHDFPPERAGAPELPEWSPRSRRDPVERLRREIDASEGVLSPALLDPVREFARCGEGRVTPYSGLPAFGHHDLLPWHLFLDPAGFQVTGVIDWEDAGLGDPAGDFAGLSMWLGPAFVEETLRHYGRTPEGIAARARLLAVEVSLIEARYAEAEDDERTRAAVRRALALNLDA
jgi:aminoglycoside phosphotransferase (APT) family kinase protein